MSFLSHPDIQVATNHASPNLSSVKEKYKKWGQLISFKSSHPVFHMKNGNMKT